MSISWSEHVKKYREENGCTYKEALQKASETYTKKVKQKKKPVEEPVEEPVERECLADPPLPMSEASPLIAETPTPTPKKLTKKQKLICICEKRGLDTKGTIQQLSDRIYNKSQ